MSDEIQVEWEIRSKKVVYPIDSGTPQKLADCLADIAWEHVEVWSTKVSTPGDWHFGREPDGRPNLQKKGDAKEPMGPELVLPDVDTAIAIAVEGILEQEDTRTGKDCCSLQGPCIHQVHD